MLSGAGEVRNASCGEKTRDCFRFTYLNTNGTVNKTRVAVTSIFAATVIATPVVAVTVGSGWAIGTLLAGFGTSFTIGMVSIARDSCKFYT